MCMKNLFMMLEYTRFYFSSSIFSFYHYWWQNAVVGKLSHGISSPGRKMLWCINSLPIYIQCHACVNLHDNFNLSHKSKQVLAFMLTWDYLKCFHCSRKSHKCSSWAALYGLKNLVVKELTIIFLPISQKKSPHILYTGIIRFSFPTKEHCKEKSLQSSDTRQYDSHILKATIWCLLNMHTLAKWLKQTKSYPSRKEWRTPIGYNVKYATSFEW